MEKLKKIVWISKIFLVKEIKENNNTMHNKQNL